MMNFSVLYIGLGGFLGSVSRYWVQQYFGRLVPGAFPLGTLVVNVLGCLLIGLLLGLFERYTVPAPWRLLLTTGFCGGFTTFSTFAYESVALGRTNELLLLALYTAGSVLLGLLAAFAGVWAARLV